MVIKRLLLGIMVLQAIAVFGQSEVEEVIWKNVEGLNNAIFVNRDSIRLSDLLSDDVSYGHSGGTIESKKEMINNALHNLTTYREVSTQRMNMHIVKNTAIVRHQLNAIQKDKDGKESPLHLGVLQVWVKEKKIWKLEGRQAVKLIVN